MKVSFVTTFYNEESQIAEFLNSLINQSLKIDEYILLDGGSTDNTMNIVKDIIANHQEVNFKLIINEKCNLKHTPGPVAKGRNLAIEQAQGEIIVISDAGCKLRTDWIEKIIEPFQNPEVNIVGGVSLLMSNSISPELKISKQKNNPSSRNIAFRKKVWESVQGYPENYLTGEDTGFNQKLIQNGYKITQQENAVVFWHAPRNIKELWRKQLGYGKGDGYNRYFLEKFLIRFPLLLFPIYYLIRKKGIYTLISALAYQKGYFIGLKESYRSL